ncbi:DUF5007 domain-containing protein [Chitinophaga terrae (ex Kim and Jung 2007)]|nr:DUF5007 domain-containing protein [Chitinophaga terrae (ex Kim and Jung 2007)]
MMKVMSGQPKYYFISLVLLLAVTLGACRKWLPEDLDYLSPKAGYTQKVFNPVLGRTTVYSRVFNTDNSTTPLSFRIVNVRLKSTGEITHDLEKMVPVWVWKKAYTGDEKSVAEIDAKRTQENHPVWEIREKSGDFILWNTADSTMLRQMPDPGYLFDVVVTNSGGTNTYKDISLAPMWQLPYSPAKDINPLTGQPMTEKYVNDTNQTVLIYNHPSVSNMIGDSTELPIINDSVRVLFRKTGNGSSVSFKFLNKDSVLMDPALFTKTQPLDSLIHGFNAKRSATAIRYDVAYPIPVVNFPTRWTTSDGSQANVSFAFDRKGFGGRTIRATLNFQFAIYQKGDWDVIFFFASDTPRFRDE